MSNALSGAWRTVAFGWRFGFALVTAALGGIVGVLVGFVVFAIFGAFAPAGYRSLVWNGGILLTGVAFAGFAFLGRFLRPAGPLDVMGSAAWATPRQLAAELAAPAGAADPAALLVGRGDGKPGSLLRYAGSAHLLTIAPTRSGKGVGTVLPNLLTAPRPVVCVDPKGENARIAARARRRFAPCLSSIPSARRASPQPATIPLLPSIPARRTWQRMPPPSPTPSCTTRPVKWAKRTGTTKPVP